MFDTMSSGRYNNDLKYVTDFMNIEMSNDINIYNVDDVVIDNNRNNIMVEITHLKGIDYEYDLYSDGSYYFYKNTSPASFPSGENSSVISYFKASSYIA